MAKYIWPYTHDCVDVKKPRTETAKSYLVLLSGSNEQAQTCIRCTWLFDTVKYTVERW